MPGWTIACQEFIYIGWERAVNDGGAHFRHQSEQHVEIVQAEELVGQDFSGLDQMPNVSAGKVSAGVAGTTFFKGGGIACVLEIAHVDAPAPGQRGTVAGYPSRQNAVKNIDAACDPIDEVFRAANTHQIAWLPCREQGNSLFEGREHLRFSFSDGQPTNSI